MWIFKIIKFNLYHIVNEILLDILFSIQQLKTKQSYKYIIYYYIPPT